MIVLFPLPFSPTRTVTPAGISSPPSAMICAPAGIVYGHWSSSGGRRSFGDHTARSKCRTLSLSGGVIRETSADIRLVHDAHQLAAGVRRHLVPMKEMLWIDDERSVRIPDDDVGIVSGQEPALVRF